jgi:hypothetical protein
LSKFVGKFRKNQDYNEDYSYTPKRNRNEHAEIKKLKNRNVEELLSELEETSLPENSQDYR